MELFFILLILLVTTRTFGEVAEHQGQPALVGALIAGIVSGAIAARYANIGSPFTFKQSFNITPSSYCPIVRLNNEKKEVALYYWGLIPSWVKKTRKLLRSMRKLKP